MDLLLKGKRINLRKLRKTDANSIYENVNNKKIFEYTLIPNPYKKNNAVDFVKISQKNIRIKKAFELGIELKESGKIIWMMSLLKFDEKNKNAEIGYWIGEKYWKQGITSEALKLILEFGFKKLKLERIYAKVMHPNKASAKLLEKNGFKYEGTMRHTLFRENKWLDDLVYSILKEEYLKKNC